MNRHQDPNPFEEEEVNPFSNGAAGSKSRTTPLSSSQRHDATVDIPLEITTDSKKKGQELAAWEADLKRREKIFYLVGFGLFCLEALLSLWVLQKIYMYFRGHK
ncbi:Secretory carrier-associated membrane protein 5 [Stylosanthes scabra]|uniref:Secretory carrier-associated membrane protein 5 n=1 Tax=Stylosanthes scabra TaxID=79078 RepID=A0ABU6T884_9FABA|nr:Secretory carrier-associated membrane protein 5 [Stylosanthes scabra]